MKDEGGLKNKIYATISVPRIAFHNPQRFFRRNFYLDD